MTKWQGKGGKWKLTNNKPKEEKTEKGMGLGWDGEGGGQHRDKRTTAQ